ncbi:Succinate dehydrogenase assembly factor 1-like protein A, mitochondrial [Penicillium digitatum]|uniref:Succinate dehydrogenase assembly factor 1-like protein A, mitochondrial n=1 Tax=Penicillium digitatum TaxID=36651 RepID=A0A7T7BJ73_PENDI|nr:Succinate dehydrogenase assembly factor 1-like protein A, mitochondrial [Penicillium digitatum]
MARLSGLQRDVLSLYRKCLREIRNKPEDSRINFRKYARAEFQKHLSVIDSSSYMLPRESAISDERTVPDPRILGFGDAYTAIVLIGDLQRRRFPRRRNPGTR